MKYLSDTSSNSSHVKHSNPKLQVAACMDFNTLLASSSREGERQTLVLLSILIVIPISDTLRGIDTPCEEILL